MYNSLYKPGHEISVLETNRHRCPQVRSSGPITLDCLKVVHMKITIFIPISINYLCERLIDIIVHREKKDVKFPLPVIIFLRGETKFKM